MLQFWAAAVPGGAQQVWHVPADLAVFQQPRPWPNAGGVPARMSEGRTFSKPLGSGVSWLDVHWPLDP